MDDTSEAEADVLRSLRCGPLYEGMFDAIGEAGAIQRLVACGAIRRVYDGPAGMLGVAKLEIVRGADAA